jgi:hypothetical protein
VQRWNRHTDFGSVREVKRDRMKWRELKWVGIRLRAGWVGDNQLVMKTSVVCTGDERK